MPSAHSCINIQATSTPSTESPRIYRQVQSPSPYVAGNLHRWGAVIFKVEGILFQVPKYHFLRHGEVFRDMFSLPQAVNGTPQGTSVENPIELEGVKGADFDNLLKVLYPITISQPNPHSDITPEEWLSVLTLSSTWMFDDLRALAIQKLGEANYPSDPIKRIVLGRRFKLREWVIDGYHKLITRSETFSTEDADEVTYPKAISICQLRETYLDHWKRMVGQYAGTF